MDLKALQAPLKQAYREDAGRAKVVLAASGSIDFERITCALAGTRHAVAGLHPNTGGEGGLACSGEMLLEALVACSGVTCAAVANAMKLEVTAGAVRAEGDWDVRGTLGVSRDAKVGFEEIRLAFELETSASDSEMEQLCKLTERYCVVLQSLRAPSPVHTTFTRVERGPSAAPGGGTNPEALRESDVVPMLSYEDAARAIAWLEEAFGFRQIARMDAPDGSIPHAELAAGSARIMLASAPSPHYQAPRRHREHCEIARRWSEVPWIIDGVLVYVDDVAAHHARATAAGATILSVPEDGFPGPRYRAEDIEGHRWMFLERSRAAR